MVTVDYSKDSTITKFGRYTLEDRYMLPGETSPQDVFARASLAFADDQEHAQRMYNYISNQWFMPATPVLSNAGTDRGLPISCFLNEASDSISGIVNLWVENVYLAKNGGGIGSYWGNLRSIGESVGQAGKTSGIIPFMKVMDSLTQAISQGSLRRGSAAVYLPINHPEIEEFIKIRKPTGGDIDRKCLNLHNAVVISDSFMNAVEKGLEWNLVSPQSGQTIKTVSARDLWASLLETRISTGEPYMLFSDRLLEATPGHHKRLGLVPKMSNLCTEITLPTGPDHLGKDRTAVCCLGSVNLFYFKEWSEDEKFIEDIMRFLDNVLTFFINNAPTKMHRAKYSAERERSVGLGAMGFHSFLQKNGIPFESVMAKSWNVKMFKFIKELADRASVKLANERGSCLDAKEVGTDERFSYKLAIAPNASISIITGEVSPGIEPLAANTFSRKTLSGTSSYRNPELAIVLQKYSMDTEETWRAIASKGGSVQHIDQLSQLEKDVFKTAFEMDQRWIIDHAADRQKFICQAQSVNIFVEPNIPKKHMHYLHYSAWKKGLKSLYYCRSKAIHRAESVFDGGNISVDSSTEEMLDSWDKLECLACQ